MKIVEINSYNDFLNLKEKWDKLLQKSEHTIFSTWEWLSIWWKHFRREKKLIILLAKDDNDSTIGIAPLMYSVHKMFGLRMGKIEFIGTPDTDYNDFILAGEKDECIRLFIDYLRSLPEKWQCIDLTEIPENSETLSILRESSKNVQHIHKCPFVLLPKSYDLFLKSLSHNLRYDLRRNIKRLEKDFRVNFEEYSSTDSCKEGMEIFYELHQKRWKSKGHHGIFGDACTRNFHHDIAKIFSEKGLLGLFILKLSNEPAAALYGFKYQKKFYYYLSGFDPKYSRYSIGNLLISHIIEKCIEEGIVEFDFMRGAEEYKNRWNTRVRWNYQVVLTKKGFKEDIKHRLYEEYWRQGNRLKYFMKNMEKILTKTL